MAGNIYERIGRVERALRKAQLQIDALEADRRSRDVVQSVVGPPDAAISRGESGRWPDRHALTKVRSMVRDCLWATERYSSLEMPRERAIEYFREILKYIEELDKGEAVATRQDDGE